MSWFAVAPGAPFGTTELPYGIYSRSGDSPRVGVAVGDPVSYTHLTLPTILLV